MEDQKRVQLAVGLSLVVLVAWTFLNNKTAPHTPAPAIPAAGSAIGPTTPAPAAAAAWPIAACGGDAACPGAF